MLRYVVDVFDLGADYVRKIRVGIFLLEQLLEMTTGEDPPEIGKLRHLAVAVERAECIVVPSTQISICVSFALVSGRVKIVLLTAYGIHHRIDDRQHVAVALAIAVKRLSVGLPHHGP